MIKITVELISAHGRSHDAQLGTAIIYNDATGTKSRGNYVARFSKRGVPFNQVHVGSGVWKAGTVKNFPRTKKNVWYLIHEALDDILSERKEGADADVPENPEH